MFRNSVQEFSNVYYYESTSGGLPSVADADGLIDTLTAREKVIHASSVTFVRGRLWSQVGTPAANEMISQKNLSGTGAGTPVSNLDKERAHLFRVRAGVDSRGNPVYLRKWYHACFGMAGVGLTDAILTQASGFSTANRTTLENAVVNILSVTQGGQTWELVAKSGRPFTVPAQFSAHQFLEHHQLGDQWRAQ